jgi:hypothetical protein
VYGLKHQKEKRSMDYFAGLHVSVKETSICIVDGTGKIVREEKVASEPQALLAVMLSCATMSDRWSAGFLKLATCDARNPCAVTLWKGPPHA